MTDADIPAESLSVLVCEDYADMRTMLSFIVNREPNLHVIGEACDGDQAISDAERLQPDIVLLDLSMPRRSGLDALPEIKRVAPAAKVIVLSAFAAHLVAPDAIARGADRYLEKGALPREIAAVIQAVAASRNGHAPPELLQPS